MRRAMLLGVFLLHGCSGDIHYDCARTVGQHHVLRFAYLDHCDAIDDHSMTAGGRVEEIFMVYDQGDRSPQLNRADSSDSRVVTFNQMSGSNYLLATPLKAGKADLIVFDSSSSLIELDRVTVTVE